MTDPRRAAVPVHALAALLACALLANVPPAARAEPTGRGATAAREMVVASGPTAAGETTAPGEATAAIRDGNARLRELLSTDVGPGSAAERRLTARVTAELRELFDIGDLARRALVDHWDEMRPRDRKAVVDTLRLVVERNYVTQLRANLAYEIEYLGEEARGRDRIVHTVVKARRKGRPVEISVDYVMRRERGGWRAYDVVTDEVSLLRNYRAQFNRIIAKEGVDGLLARLRSRAERRG